MFWYFYPSVSFFLYTPFKLIYMIVHLVLLAQKAFITTLL